MKNIKKKILIMSAFCFVVALAFVISGVFAASQLKYEIEGVIEFESNDCWVNVEGQVEGSANPIESYQHFSKGQSSSKTWDIGAVDFDRSKNNTITIPLAFANYSYYKVKATISGIPESNENFEIDVSSTVLYMLEYVDGGVADEEVATLTFTLKPGVESASCPLSLSVVFQRVEDIELSPYFTYTTSGTTATITGLTAQGASRSAIEVPDKIGSNTVAAIGANAFASKTNLKRVKLPDTITNIGVSAFENCSNIEEINIPSALETLSSKAFKNCLKIKQINIPNSVGSVGTSAFEGCEKLEMVHLPIGLTEIKDSTFLGCANLAELNYPETLTSIGENAFAFCSSLQSVTIPTGITTIGSQAFRYCVRLSEINYQATNCVDFSYNSKVFANSGVAYSGITMNVSNNVTKIPAYLFAETFGGDVDNMLAGQMVGANIAVVNFQSGSNCVSVGEYAFAGSQNLAQFNIPSSVTTIGKRAFYSSGLTSVCIPEGVTSLGIQSFMDCRKLASVEYRAVNCADLSEGAFHNATSESSFVNMSVIIANTVKHIPNNLFKNLEYLTSLRIEGNTLETIGEYSFASTKISALSLPTSLTSIGKFAFSACSSMSGTVVIPEGIETINEGAFEECCSITSLTIPSTVKTIGVSAFSGAKALTILNYNAISCADFANDNNVFAYAGQSGSGITLTFGSNVEVIPANLFYPHSSTTSIQPNFNCAIQIPSVIKTIGTKAFYKCSGLTGGIVFPEGFTTINNYIFADCSGITSITIPSTVTTIGSYAFSNTTSLTELNYNATNCASLTTNNYAFSYSGKDSSGISLSIGDNVVSIPAYLFYPRSSYAEYSPNIYGDLTFSNTVETIGTGAFAYCKNIQALTFGSSVSTIGANAFIGCSGITGEVVVPEGVTTINSYTFSGCSGVTSFTIPSTITKIGNYAFYSTEGLTTLNYNAIACGNLSSNNYTFASSGKAGDGISVVFAQNIEVIPAYLFYPASSSSYAHKLKGDIIIPDSVKTIGSNAFYNCTGITSIQLGAGLESIGSFGFYGCNKIAGQIEFPSSISSIGAYAFYNCTSLTGALVLPEALTSVANNTFQNCSGITSLNIPKLVASISDYAFGGMTMLTEINYDAEVCTMTSTHHSFNNCGTASGGITVNFLDNVKKIPAYLFCSSSDTTPVISTINIGEKVEKIENYAFYRCQKLTAINYNAIACDTSSSTSTSNNYIFYDAGTSGTGINVTFGSKVTSIPAGLFNPYGSSYSPKIVGEIIIPDNVTTIGRSAFYNLMEVTSLTIGTGVTKIESKAFHTLSRLTTLNFNAIACADFSSSDYVFSNCGVMGGNITLTIGEGVTKIPSYFLSSVSKIKGTIRIPASVTTIGKSAFSSVGATSAIFAVTSGWYVTTTAGGASGTSLTLTNTSTVATYLKSTYINYYWYRT